MIELPLLGDARPQRSTPRHWRSAEQLRNATDFSAHHAAEFAPGALEAPSQANRRQFLQLAGAGAALMGLSACRRPVEKILPYTRKPEEVIEGIAQYYATAMPHRGHVRALLAESHEGRPTKLEGNPEHPVSQGASGLHEQASILNLYDPDRSRLVRQGADEKSWADFVQFAAGLQGPFVVLAEPSSSPTRARLQGMFEARFPGTRWITYRAEGDDNAAMGAQMGAGRPLRALYDFSQAQTIVSLDADFLSPADPNELVNSRTFAQSRRPETGAMSRLYVVESTHSTTGAAADHRLRMRAGAIGTFGAALASRLGVGGGGAASFTEREGLFLDAIAADLLAAGPRGVVLAGSTQPPEVHALALAINAALGSRLVQMLDTGEAPQASQAQEMAALVRDMQAGAVQNMLILGVNPAYDAPGAFGFGEALRQVRNTIHAGTHVDETAVLCAWHVPTTHFLEMWGDGRAYDGTLSVIQPLIAPLNLKTTQGNERNDLHSDIELLNLLAAGTDVGGYDLVRETWRGQLAGPFEESWRKVVHDGFAPGTAYPAVPLAAGAVALPALPASAELEVAFRLDPKMLDGQFANNAWMIELPDMVTKLVWDNVALVSRATADRLDLHVAYDAGKFYADVIELDVEGRTQQLPVWIQPGHPDDAITVNLGWGRDIVGLREEHKRGFFSFFDTSAASDVYGHGPIGNDVGRNVAPLRPASYAAFAPAQVRKVDTGYLLVSTQEHGAMEGRPLILETTLDAYRADPQSLLHHHTAHMPGGDVWDNQEPLWGSEREAENQPFFKDNPYYRNQWAMVVDLTTCSGCQACVVACQAENNIQVVGKEQVGKGREMHWLRMDRYYIGDEDDDTVRMAFQYLTCVHCENAPCETVCPVSATVHSPDGTNQMIYNRCVGTRYCSNNCPYKVRRYNWFNWTKDLPIEVQMQQNPDVTVRFRGVMEKCSYCIQRIREMGRQAILESRNIRDGEVQTACQQACAARAITFGDIADPDSAVSRAKRNPRRYELLAELGTKPRTSYLGRVRNLNSRLAPFEPVEHAEPHPADERTDVGEPAPAHS